MASIDTVNDLPPRVSYIATAGQTAFDYPFPIFDDEDLVVYVDGVLKTYETDYTVSGAGDDTGGTVTLTSALEGDEDVVIYRDIAMTRDTDVAQNGPWSSTAYNNEQDKIFLLLQQLRALFKRSIRFPQAAELADEDMELDPANFANRYLAFDAAGAPTPAALSAETMTQATIGGLLYPRTAAEITADVTPTNYAYAPGDVRRYGAVMDGTTDDWQAFVDAISTIATRGTILIPNGHYALSGTLTVPGNVSLVGESMHGVLLDWSASEETLDNNAMIWSEGAGLTALPALAASITPDSKVVVFDEEPDLEPGDLLQVYDTADGSYSASRPEYRAGEFLQVASVSGANVTLTAYPYASYDYESGTVGVEKVDSPSRSCFANFTIKGRNDNDYPLRVRYGRGNRISNIAVSDNTLDALSCVLCYDVAFAGVRVDVLDPLGSNNVRGLSIHNSQNVTVSGSTLIAARHGLNTGGSETKGVVCRAITVSSSIIRNNVGSGSNNAANLHGNTEYFLLTGCLTEGVGLAGNRNSVQGCTIIGNSNRAIHLSEMTGLDFDITGCTLKVNTYSDGTRGCFLDIGGAGDAFAANTTRGGTFVFRGNTCRYLTDDSTIDGITVRNRGCTAPMRFVFSDNIFEGSPDATGHRDILFMDVVSGNRINSVIWANNKRCNGWGLNVSETAHLEIDGNSFTAGGHTGIRGGDNKVIRCQGNYITGFQRDGVALDSGSGLGSDEVCYFDDNIVSENNITSDGQQAGVTLRRFAAVYARRNAWGGAQAGQVRPASFNTLTVLHETGNRAFGTGSVQYTSVGTRVPGTVADSAASDVPGVVADLNTLLAALRSSDGIGSP